MGVPWYAIVLMLVGPGALGLARVCIVVAHRLGWQRDPRPGYVDLVGRDPVSGADAKVRHT